MVVPLVIIIVLCFYLLGSTADEYLSPALETISNKLGISEALAGVTFLAFGNGAPDVIGAISASGADLDGAYLALSALLGAGFFVSGVVTACVTLMSPVQIKLEPLDFLRDTGFYMLGPIILLIAALVGKISIPIIVSLLVVYIVFILVVIITSCLTKKERSSSKDSFSDKNTDIA